ncbi:MAG: bifunctional transcriptional activator/DNA repair enzyme AdaA [Phycisphaerales bacterium]
MNSLRLPSPDEMFAAVAARDTSFDGVFMLGVRTTGVFCRPGCAARTPRRENIEFFATATEAMQAGYRACKRCRPLHGPGDDPPWMTDLIATVETDPRARLTSHDLRARGVDPARASRAFKRRFGVTFQAFCRAKRVGGSLAAIRRGFSPARAAAAAGYTSESGFAEAFRELFGAPPGAARHGAGLAPAVVEWIESPLGPLLAAAVDDGVCLLEFMDRRAIETQVRVLRARLARPIVPGKHPLLDRLKAELSAYFAGDSPRFTVPLISPGTPFQSRVWEALRAIPPGVTRSYADIARAIGRPTATRAVARANGDNRLAILIPCHRVIGADGTLTGYGGGLWRKQWLLDHERSMTGGGGLFASTTRRPRNAAVPSSS